jgi:signal transduction histidine kinase
VKRSMGSRPRTKKPTKNIMISEEILDKFIHELRSSLTPIVGWSDLMKQKNNKEKSWEHAVEIINQSAKTQTSEISRFEKMLQTKRDLKPRSRLHKRRSQ